MKPSKFAVAILGILLLASPALFAQGTNLPATYLENFELQTNTILVKGYSLIGNISLENNLTMSVLANEANDITHSQKAYGIVLESNRGSEGGRCLLVLDYDEIDSLTSGIEYVSKVTWGVTQLNGFQASYKTKSGFQVSAHSDRRQQNVETSIEFADGPRIETTPDQLLQIRSLIIQAKATLDGLK